MLVGRRVFIMRTVLADVDAVPSKRLAQKADKFIVPVVCTCSGKAYLFAVVCSSMQ